MYLNLLSKTIMQMSLLASLIIVGLLILRPLLKKIHSPAISIYFLWGLVLLRLLCPVAFSSSYSFWGLTQPNSMYQKAKQILDDSVFVSSDSSHELVTNDQFTESESMTPATMSPTSDGESHSLPGKDQTHDSESQTAVALNNKLPIPSSVESASTEVSLAASEITEKNGNNTITDNAVTAGTNTINGNVGTANSNTTTGNDGTTNFNTTAGNDGTTNINTTTGNVGTTNINTTTGNVGTTNINTTTGNDSPTDTNSNQITGITGVSVTTIFAHLWLAGVLAMLLWGAIAYLRFRKRLMGSTCIMKTRGRTKIFLCDYIDSAFVMPHFPGRIYLPSGLDSEDMKVILEHELVHLHRCDMGYRLLAYIALCLHWFNPLCWIAFFLSEQDMELACDEKVTMKMSKSERKKYAEILLNHSTRHNLLISVPVAFGKGDTKMRILNILNKKRCSKLTTAFITALTIALFVGCGTNPAVADNKTSEIGTAGTEAITSGEADQSGAQPDHQSDAQSSGQPDAQPNGQSGNQTDNQPSSQPGAQSGTNPSVQITAETLLKTDTHAYARVMNAFHEQEVFCPESDGFPSLSLDISHEMAILNQDLGSFSWSDTYLPIRNVHDSNPMLKLTTSNQVNLYEINPVSVEKSNRCYLELLRINYDGQEELEDYLYLVSGEDGLANSKDDFDGIYVSLIDSNVFYIFEGAEDCCNQHEVTKKVLLPFSTDSGNYYFADTSAIENAEQLTMVLKGQTVEYVKAIETLTADFQIFIPYYHLTNGKYWCNGWMYEKIGDLKSEKYSYYNIVLYNGTIDWQTAFVAQEDWIQYFVNNQFAGRNNFMAVAHDYSEASPAYPVIDISSTTAASETNNGTTSPLNAKQKESFEVVNQYNSNYYQMQGVYRSLIYSGLWFELDPSTLKVCEDHYEIDAIFQKAIYVPANLKVGDKVLCTFNELTGETDILELTDDSEYPLKSNNHGDYLYRPSEDDTEVALDWSGDDLELCPFYEGTLYISKGALAGFYDTLGCNVYCTITEDILKTLGSGFNVVGFNEDGIVELLDSVGD